MFSGIIETIGSVKSIQRGNNILRLDIQPKLDDYPVSIGGSVSVDGVCLTVESISGRILNFTAVYETLEHTTLARIRAGDLVNLERALRLIDRLNGHIVLGHVDGVGHIISDTHKGDNLLRKIWIPEDLRRFMVYKGSVALDGISFTIAEGGEETITIAIIPYTLSETTMSIKRSGWEINIECDIFARYIFRQLNFNRLSDVDKGNDFQKNEFLSNKDILTLMEKNGF